MSISFTCIPASVTGSRPQRLETFVRWLAYSENSGLHAEINEGLSLHGGARRNDRIAEYASAHSHNICSAKRWKEHWLHRCSARMFTYPGWALGFANTRVRASLDGMASSRHGEQEHRKRPADASPPSPHSGFWGWVSNQIVRFGLWSGKEGDPTVCTGR